MKLYIWEGNGISDAYHDDGTLVVLAESAEQAREVVRAEKAAEEAEMERIRPAQQARGREERQEVLAAGGYSAALWKTEAGKAILAKRIYPSREFMAWDGSEAALDREPDRVVEINTPTVVAFNGGGYD